MASELILHIFIFDQANDYRRAMPRVAESYDRGQKRNTLLAKMTLDSMRFGAPGFRNLPA